MTSSPVESLNASSTSLVERPRAYISATRRSNTSELPSKNSMRFDLNGAPASRTCGTRTGIRPSAVVIAES